MDSGVQAMRQLPQYQCHKKVWALKIAAIKHFSRPTCKGCFALGSASGSCERCEFEKNNPGGLGAILVAAEEGQPSVLVTGEYLRKHKPEVGGYWVQYADGYESFSPAEAFEEGYTLIS